MDTQEYDGPPYSKVRQDFWERRDLNAVEKLILQYLHSRRSANGEPWDVNADQIRIVLHLGYDATDKALAKLKDKGWLTDNRQPSRDDNGQMRREKSVVIESRRGEVIVPDMAESGKPDTEQPDTIEHPGVSQGRTESGCPDLESPTVMDNPPMEDSSTGDDPWDVAIAKLKAKEAAGSVPCPRCKQPIYRGQGVHECKGKAKPAKDDY